MMTLYFSPGACSRAPHIAFRELGLDVAIEKVDLRAKTTAGGADYRAINAKGSVPALVLEGGSVLTEVAVLLQYLADLKPEAKLGAQAGTMDRYRLQEMLNFIATEVHKGFGPLFTPTTPPELREATVTRLGTKLTFLADKLGDGEWLLGHFTIADVYFFTVFSWADLVKLDVSAWPTLVAHRDRMRARPAVIAAIAAEEAARKAS